MKYLLKNATLVCKSQPKYHLKKRDILIENGTISKIAASINTKGKVKEISQENLHVSVGWFDPGVAFGEPGFEERETLENGLRVASKSGFTDIILHSNTSPIPDSSGDIVFLKKQAPSGPTQLHPLGALTKGGQGKELAELFDMHGAGAVGFSDYKTPTASPNIPKLALQYCQSFGGMVWAFAQDEALSGHGIVHEGEQALKLGLKGIPDIAEVLRINRDLVLLEYTSGKLHIPWISSEHAIPLIAKAKKAGLDVSCSVSIQNLYFTDKELQHFDTDFKLSPPLRTEKDVKALRKALADGIIDFASSDHSPMNPEEKQLEFDQAAYGSTGLESSFGVLNLIFGMETAIEILCRGRRRFGLEDVEIAEGKQANLTLFDPDLKYTQQLNNLNSSSKNCAFKGRDFQGKPLGVIRGIHNYLNF